jgi:hypothetical protein
MRIILNNIGKVSIDGYLSFEDLLQSKGQVNVSNTSYLILKIPLYEL